MGGNRRSFGEILGICREGGKADLDRSAPPKLCEREKYSRDTTVV